VNITLEQARTLDAVVRHGSFAKAARALHKVHSAVVYGLKGLEDSVGVPVFDRTGYRTVLTPLGRRVHALCLRILAAEAELDLLCQTARAGYEPRLGIVFDGLLPVEPILRAVRAVSTASPLTRVSLSSEFLGEVEARAEREQAEVMLSVVAPERPIGPAYPLTPLVSLLVAHQRHPLARARKKLTAADLEAHPFLTVRASDQRLAMSTSALDKATEFKLSDFHAKKVALMAGMGYGWMPEYLVTKELAKKSLVVLRFGEGGGRHAFRPVLHCRQAAVGGPAMQALVEALTPDARGA
jgi:DNA-binding transcriptional LysR family regulator